MRMVQLRSALGETQDLRSLKIEDGLDLTETDCRCEEMVVECDLK